MLCGLREEKLMNSKENRPYVLVDTPANRAALEPLAVQIYNALGELRRQVERSPAPDSRGLIAAMIGAEIVLIRAKVRAEARSDANAVALAAELVPGIVRKARRYLAHSRGPQTPLVKKPYEALEVDPKER